MAQGGVNTNVTVVQPVPPRHTPHTCEAVLAAGLEQALAYNRLWGKRAPGTGPAAAEQPAAV